MNFVVADGLIAGWRLSAHICGLCVLTLQIVVGVQMGLMAPPAVTSPVLTPVPVDLERRRGRLGRSRSGTDRVRQSASLGDSDSGGPRAGGQAATRRSFKLTQMPGLLAILGAWSTTLLVAREPSPPSTRLAKREADRGGWSDLRRTRRRKLYGLTFVCTWTHV